MQILQGALIMVINSLTILIVAGIGLAMYLSFRLGYEIGYDRGMTQGRVAIRKYYEQVQK
jgi:hypothetical protein